MREFQKGDKVAIKGQENDQECCGVICQPTVAAYHRVLVEFPAPKKSGGDRIRQWIEKERLTRR